MTKERIPISGDLGSKVKQLMEYAGWYEGRSVDISIAEQYYSDCLLYTSQAKPSHRELLDNALSQSPANFEELLKLLQESGCEVSKRLKNAWQRLLFCVLTS